MLPYLEVTHLPSSSSFYSAILQPLGLRYLSAESSPESPSAVTTTLTYGTSSPPTPVFQVRQVEPDSISASRIVFTAPSPAAVADFYSFALRANPDLEKSTSDGAAHGRATESRASITDFDGNTMEVAYLPPTDYPTRYGGSTVRKTQSTSAEASRILDWNYGVAASTPSRSATGPAFGATRPPAARPPASRYAENEPYSALRRSVPTSTSVYEPTASPRENSNGVSTGTVVGTLLGVAAGAALTYSMVKDSPAQGAREEFDPPAFARRSTYPEPPGGPRGRYVEVERNVEKVRYPKEYPPVVDRRPAPEYIARYSQAGSARSREVDDVYDDSRSRRSSRYRPASVRTRSEASTSRKPFLIADSEHRSYVGSKHSNTPPITRSVVHRSNTYDVGDRGSYAGSYASARSQRSASTIRAAPPLNPSSSSQVAGRSRAGSRVTTTTIKVRGTSPGARQPSRAGSYASARNIPLPPSTAGTGYRDWDDDGGSIAPSESISCVGSRRSGRSYH